jgi:predicted TPR repeat methyltransferase
MDEQQPQERQVTFDEALAIARDYQRRGLLADAADVYRRMMEVEPLHPELLHYAGVLAHQSGRSEVGIEMIQRSLELAPDRAECYNNLGIIYKAKGRFDAALEAYQRAVALDPGHVQAHNNIGVLLKSQRHIPEAEAAYRTAIRLNPDYAAAYHNLGILLGDTNRLREAVVCYCKVTTLSPEHKEARRLLAMAHCTLGEVDKAIAIMERWVADEPDNPVPQHLLAACSGRDVPARAGDRFIEKVFDEFADTFDGQLEHLAYRAPQIIAAMLADSGTPATKELDVLDAGCGTGLCGPLVSRYARRLTGVDLSARMLDKARARQVYDELVKAELTGFISSRAKAFDIIVCADTLCYFGSLEDVAVAASRALRPGGQFFFTVEALYDSEAVSEAESERGFRLATHGRYTHAQPYVKRVLTNAGLTVQVVRAELRMESGVPVAGLAVRASLGSSGGAGLYSADASPQGDEVPSTPANGARDA